MSVCGCSPLPSPNDLEAQLLLEALTCQSTDVVRRDLFNHCYSDNNPVSILPSPPKVCLNHENTGFFHSVFVFTFISILQVFSLLFVFFLISKTDDLSNTHFYSCSDFGFLMMAVQVQLWHFITSELARNKPCSNGKVIFCRNNEKEEYRL